MSGGIGAALLAAGLICWSTLARAECTKDTDCKDQRVCEEGRCTAPPETTPAQPEAARSQPAPQHDVHFFDDDDGDAKPRKQRKRIGNPGMLAGGIVLAASGPVLLMVGVLTTLPCNHVENNCNSDAKLLGFGFGLGSLALIGIGIPLIVIGAKRVPIGHVALAPWVSPRQAGLALRLDL